MIEVVAILLTHWLIDFALNMLTCLASTFSSMVMLVPMSVNNNWLDTPC